MEDWSIDINEEGDANTASCPKCGAAAENEIVTGAWEIHSRWWCENCGHSSEWERIF